eukprot:8478821-Lingulodinium_polyedra.AAC.1
MAGPSICLQRMCQFICTELRNFHSRSRTQRRPRIGQLQSGREALLPQACQNPRRAVAVFRDAPHAMLILEDVEDFSLLASMFLGIKMDVDLLIVLQ